MALASSRAGNPKWPPDSLNTKPLLPEYCLCSEWVKPTAFFTECLKFLLFGCIAACSQTESEDGLRVLDEAEGEKEQGESGKAQAEQADSWLDDFVKGLDDMLDDMVEGLGEFVEGLDENGLVGGGLVLERGIFPAGVVVGSGVLVL